MSPLEQRDQRDPVPVSAPPAASLRDADDTLSSVARFASSLPRLLIDLNATLLACQNAEQAGQHRQMEGGKPEASIAAARFALAEATTAALTLAHRLAEASRTIAGLVGDEEPSCEASMGPRGSLSLQVD